MKSFLLLSLVSLAASFSQMPIITRAQRTSGSHLSASSIRGSQLPAYDQNDPQQQQQSTKPVAPAKKLNWIAKQTLPDAMIEPSYYLTWAVALLGPLIIWYHPPASDGSLSLIGVAGGGFHLLFATLLWVQTRRVRCVFEKDSFEFYNIKGPGLDLDNGAWLEKKPANYVAGTPNRWKYDKIINYGFFPSIHFPVICYFKETETPKEQWSKWFAAFDSYGCGQPHFFPGICNVQEFKEQMELRGVKSKPIPTLRKRN